MRFENKVVLVLGGNSGMGLATAQAFAAEGGKVHLTGRDQATIDAAVAGIPGSTGYRSDIADVAATEAVVTQIEAADGRIDVLYINAGVGGFARCARSPRRRGTTSIRSTSRAACSRCRRRCGSWGAADRWW